MHQVLGWFGNGLGSLKRLLRQSCPPSRVSQEVLKTSNALFQLTGPSPDVLRPEVCTVLSALSVYGGHRAEQSDSDTATLT